MAQKNILYISGSLGLGHITRDLAIARELREYNTNLDICWLAAHPASLLVKEAGEKLLPEADLYANDNIPAETAAKGCKLNLLKYLNKARKEWAQNFQTFELLTGQKQFDLVIGDETYEIAVGLMKKPGIKKAPFVMIYDFLGLDAMTKNPLEKIGIYMWNRLWSLGLKQSPAWADLVLFIGEEEDIPDRRFGFMLPNRRNLARERCKFVGYALQFDPADYTDRVKIRGKLGYGQEPLVVCAIGGTSIGKDLLDLCGRAFPMISEEIPDLRMLLVCGPRLPAESLKVPPGVEVRGHIPCLFEHFAASDLAIVLGGATSTLELTALRRPFIYFPVEGHCEQEVNVAPRIARHRAGIRMTCSETTPQLLAEKVISNLGKEVSYKSIPTDGTRKAAQLIGELLERKS